MLILNVLASKEFIYLNHNIYYIVLFLNLNGGGRMAKTYKIDLSDPGAKTTIVAKFKTKAGIEEKEIKENLREMELSILEQLFSLATNLQKDMNKAIECHDCVEQVLNITEGEMKIGSLTDQDMTYLNEGFSATARTIDKDGVLSGGRPNIWLDKCKHIFVQMVKPVEDKPVPKK